VEEKRREKEDGGRERETYTRASKTDLNQLVLAMAVDILLRTLRFRRAASARNQRSRSSALPHCQLQVCSRKLWDLHSASSRGQALVAEGRRGKGFGDLVLQASEKRSANKEGGGTCPCGEARPYSKCCKAYHQRKQQAETPKKLLQTRFAAYAKGLSRYIVDTQVMPDQDADAEADLIRSIEASCAKVKFLGLTVLEEAVKDDLHAVIKFRYQAKVVNQKGFREGKAEAVEETSHFVKDPKSGKWYFNEGMTDKNPSAASD
jgi:SEC-C motif-containing protein